MKLPASSATVYPPTQPQPRRVIEVGGGQVELDELGPIVVNSDGSLSRISNWGSLLPLAIPPSAPPALVTLPLVPPPPPLLKLSPKVLS